MKKIILIGLILSGSMSIQADFGSSLSAFVGAFFGALFGSSSERENRDSYRHDYIATKCACGESSVRKLKTLTCCGAVLCKSCLISRRHTASIEKTSPKCHGCGKSFDYDTALQQAAMNSYSDQGHRARAPRQVRPTAPVLNPEEDYAQRCASGCNSAASVDLHCRGGHSMCSSCLRSRVKKAVRVSGGDQPYVVCPRCDDMLTDPIISRFK